MPKVNIVGTDNLVRKMFLLHGWEIADLHDADLIQFTCGADIDPSLYGEERHATTASNPKRDAIESHIFHSLKDTGVKMAGICRGGQLLNTLRGGKMWQNVDEHLYVGQHKALYEDKEVVVSSDHHQMMRPSKEAKILVTAHLSTFRESATEKNTSPDFIDIEAVYYPDTLCCQFRPEIYWSDHECNQLYFELIDKYLDLR